LEKLVRTTSLNHALSLGIDKMGRIEEGYVADIVILDGDFRVQAVFIEGKRKI
jgi:N-acetylglucosamine-6-phosphate deacetylase